MIGTASSAVVGTRSISMQSPRLTDLRSLSSNVTNQISGLAPIVQRPRARTVGFLLSGNRSWFEIRAASNLAAAEIHLYDAIGSYGVTAAAFVDALNAVKQKTINLFVNSPGGDCADGKTIFNALKRHPATVNAVVDGWAASAASFIIQAADKISMGTGSLLMIHDPYAGAIGDAATMEKMLEYLNAEGDSIAAIYAERAGGDPEEWREKMRAETWYKAQEAVDAGLADALVVSGKAKNQVYAFNLADLPFKNVPEWAPVASEPEPIKVAARSHMKVAAYLDHHDEDGRVDQSRVAVALNRANNLAIPVANREQVIRHLQAHAGRTV